ncbi:MAG: hypothetical protein ACFCU1_12560, partial [Sumerlaeia bacterium]
KQLSSTSVSSVFAQEVSSKNASRHENLYVDTVILKIQQFNDATSVKQKKRLKLLFESNV